MRSRHLSALGLAALLLVGLAGCGSSPPAREDVEAALATLRDTTLDEGARAIESELLDRGRELAGADGEPRHLVSVLDVGADALAARLHLARAAQRTIDVQVFIWGPDDSGVLLFRELVAAARRGVRVRIIVDQMGVSDGLAAAAVAHENLAVRLFNPIENKSANTKRELFYSAALDFQLVNHRMHNKVYVVDDALAIVGGRNVEDHYFDLDPDFDYIDRDALVLGPVAADVTRSFEEYWESELVVPVDRLHDVASELVRCAAAGEAPPRLPHDLGRTAAISDRASLRAADEVLPHSPLLTVDRVAFHADPPSKRETRGEIFRDEEEEWTVIGEAQDYVLVQSNYLIFTDQTLNRLAWLKREKPQVVVHYGTNSFAAGGCGLCYALSRKQRLYMEQAGLRIHELRPVPADVRHFVPTYDDLIAADVPQDDEEQEEMFEGAVHLDERRGPQLAIHAKTIVIDGRVALIGSHNFDPRSELRNTEGSLLLWGGEVVPHVERELRLAMENRNSWTIARRRRPPVWNETVGVVASISRLLPVFDLWPFRHTSAFDLREGCEPVPVDDPRFYDHYEDVGELPEVPLGLRRTTNYLFSAFGGVTRSLF